MARRLGGWVAGGLLRARVAKSPARPPRTRPAAPAARRVARRLGGSAARRLGGPAQGLRERRRGRVAVRGELLQCGVHRVGHVVGHRLPERAQRPRRLRHQLDQHRLGGRGAEGRFAAQHLVEHRAERVDVAPAVHRALGPGLLRAHVLRGAEREAGLGEPGSARLLHRECDAEVGEQRVAALQQDVLRLDVAVDHALGVGVAQRFGHLDRDPDCVGHRELALAVHPRAERLARHVRHHVEHLPRGRAGVEEREDAGVGEVGGGADLGEEALDAEHGAELGVEHLHRHLATVPHVLGQPDGGHPAAAELAVEPIPVGEGGGEAGGRPAHRCPAPCSRRTSPGRFWITSIRTAGLRRMKANDCPSGAAS